MKVLLIGSGGREHALAWKLAQSPKLEKLYIAPGNAGTAAVGENVPIEVNDFDGIRDHVIENGIGMVVVGPEAPLVNGIRDYFKVNESLSGIPLIGPGREGAQLEGSKEFAKRFMERHRIPTAAYRSFAKNQLNEAIDYLDEISPPYVLKADGLAAGKGVLILDQQEEARAELTAMLEHDKFGNAGNKVVIEAFLDGIELSVFVLTDGDAYLILPEAKDYKRIGEGDTGLNTGGMGAVSPVPFADSLFMEKVEKRIVKPTIDGLKQDGISYEGFVFIGLMNVKGDPYVIEYNVRMGDPETEAVVPRIKSDLLDIFEGVANKSLAGKQLVQDERTAATVMLVSGGYPGDYKKGKVVRNIEKTAGSLVFHAGTRSEDDEVVTNGGRVLAITSLGTSMKEALAMSYRNAALIDFENKYYRTDIGFDLKEKHQHA